jgi:integrase
MTRRATSRRSPGIVERHSRSCASRGGGECKCRPSFEAWAWDRREGKKIRKTFPTLAAAKAWRTDAVGEVRRGTLKAAPSILLRDAAAAWLAGAREGSIRTRSGDIYKPAAIRGYERSLRLRILPGLGTVKLVDVRRSDVQDLADRMLAAGLNASTIRNALMPLRAIYRRAVSRGEVTVNPTTAVELPAVRGRRDRIVTPQQAAGLLEALDQDRALWAAALYSGLRRGELMALRWEDVDLAKGLLRVERSWDVMEGVVDPKSRAGRRVVPIPTVLREHLVAHKLRCAWADGLVFGRSASRPFEPVSVGARAAKAWSTANAQETKRAEEERRQADVLPAITLHEARHTFASLMIAAGVNAKALSTYMGHASVTITLDRYGHLMPGNETEAASLLDAYLARADGRL